MIAALERLDAQLHDHFARLAADKQGGGHPVFALEHGLTSDELAALADGLEKTLQTGWMTDRFWLCWVVHAAEHGYVFEGLEFWPSFAAKTPSWNRYAGTRERLRLWFVRFTATFRGARPHGSWAANYPYISWPITHALLSSDLQHRLTASIYRMRHRLGAASALTPAKAGALAATCTHQASNHYWNFLARKELVGRIVLALLQEPEDQTAIHVPTLKRIVRDLNRRRETGEMLQAARRYYARYRAQTSASVPSYSLVPRPSADEDASELNTVLLRPSVLLERTGPDHWRASLELPSFQSLSNRDAAFAEHLTWARYSVPCHGDAAYLARNLITARRQHALRRWPRDHEPLLRFSEPLASFDFLVDSECRVPVGPTWVFRIHADGATAHLVGAPAMHPGENYVVLLRDPGTLTDTGRRIQVDCDGVTARAIDLPDFVGPDLRQALTNAGIAVTRGIEIQPVGLLPRQWNADDGASEWLTTETPCFSISRDHPFDAFEVSIGGAEPAVFPCVGDATLVLFTLPQLPAGNHALVIRSRSDASVNRGIQRTYHGLARLWLSVREPSVWIPGQLCHPAMVVDTTPAAPTLDDLVDERLNIQVHGDQARNATFTLVLLSAAGVESTRRELFTRALPVTPDDWLTGWRTATAKDRDDYQYLTAGGGYIQISNPDLGSYRVNLRRPLHPLRWTIRRTKATTDLRLINDGDESRTVVTSYRFTTPAREQSEDIDRHLLGMEVPSQGGLYVAAAEGEERGVVVAPVRVEHDLKAAFGANVDISVLAGEGSVEVVASAYRRWSSAEAMGGSAAYKRRDVLTKLHQHLLQLACGPGWMRIEHRLTAPDAPSPLWSLVEEAVGARNFAVSLAFRWNAAQVHTLEEARLLHAKVTDSFGIGSGVNVRQAAWNLATSPAECRTSHLLHNGVFMHDVAILVRAARYLHLRLTLEE